LLAKTPPLTSLERRHVGNDTSLVERVAGAPGAAPFLLWNEGPEAGVLDSRNAARRYFEIA
jgi:hypothetical protein